MKKLLLLAASLFATAALAEAPSTVTAEALLSRIEAADATLLVLDVRTPEEFAQGHLPGATNIAYDQLESRLGELAGARDKDVVLYCRSGRRAEVAAETLARGGFKRLAQLEGDYPGWSAAGLPTGRPAGAALPAAAVISTPSAP
jgi:phage shock protein E